MYNRELQYRINPRKTCIGNLLFPMRNNKFGFTLFEILIVITIIVILAGAAAPNFRNFYAQTLQRDATRRVATVLRTAQNLAVIHRVQMQVQFHLEKNQYQIIPDPELIEEGQPLPRYARKNQLPDDVKFIGLEFNTMEKIDPTKDIRTINFYPNGSSDGGTIKILSGKLNEITTIEIKKSTGNVIVTVESTVQEPVK